MTDERNNFNYVKGIFGGNKEDLSRRIKVCLEKLGIDNLFYEGSVTDKVVRERVYDFLY